MQLGDLLLHLTLEHQHSIYHERQDLDNIKKNGTNWRTLYSKSNNKISGEGKKKTTITNMSRDSSAKTLYYKSTRLTFLGR